MELVPYIIIQHRLDQQHQPARPTKCEAFQNTALIWGVQEHLLVLGGDYPPLNLIHEVVTHPVLPANTTSRFSHMSLSPSQPKPGLLPCQRQGTERDSEMG